MQNLAKLIIFKARRGSLKDDRIDNFFGRSAKVIGLYLILILQHGTIRKLHKFNFMQKYLNGKQIQHGDFKFNNFMKNRSGIGIS